MSSLWGGVAILSVLALLFLLLPLLRIHRKLKPQSTGSDAEQDNVLIFRERLSELDAEQAQGTLEATEYIVLKAELEKTLLQDVEGKQSLDYIVEPASLTQAMSLFSGAIILIIASLLVYLDLGRSGDYADFLVLQSQVENPPVSNAKQAPDFAKAIQLLQQKLVENPADIEKSILLANSYIATGQYNKSAEVYVRLAQHLGETHPDYARVKGSYAQALFQAEGEKFTSTVDAAIKAALAVDSQESTALILTGIRAYMQMQYAEAITAWQQAKQKAEPLQIQRFIEPAIAEARVKSGLKITEKTQAEPSASDAQIVVNLSLAPELAGRVQPEHTVFVFARAVGGRMPLAIERFQVKDLPKQIILDDTKAAMPTATLSSVDVVDIVARISLSGSAKPQAGDVFVEQKAVQTKKNRALKLVMQSIF